jgi:soluble cytochrome b562
MFYNKKIFKRCFNWRGKYWYKNIKEIPLYFKLMRHLIKHGYDEYATWETFDWFIDTMREVLTSYRKSHIGYPVHSLDTEYDEEKVAKEYDEGLDKMISLLDDMDESNPKYEAEEYKDINGIVDKHNEMYAAKDEFFKMFSEYFYCLWD